MRKEQFMGPKKKEREEVPDPKKSHEFFGRKALPTKKPFLTTDIGRENMDNYMVESGEARLEEFEKKNSPDRYVPVEELVDAESEIIESIEPSKENDLRYVRQHETPNLGWLPYRDAKKYSRPQRRDEITDRIIDLKRENFVDPERWEKMTPEQRRAHREMIDKKAAILEKQLNKDVVEQYSTPVYRNKFGKLIKKIFKRKENAA